MSFINETDVIGKIIEAGTQTITGNLFLTLLIIFLVLFILCIVFGIPMEFSLIIIWPFFIAMMAYFGTFWVLAIAIAFYLGFIGFKNWYFR